MYTLVYSSKADSDLSNIFNYIASNNRNSAIKYLSELEKVILELKDYPESGHIANYPELASLGIRMLSYDKYLIFYTINNTKQEIYISRILRSSINYIHLFKD